MRHLDLFSGIGGFSLAARWMGWETVAQVEWDKWCQKVLAKNFPDALRFGDIVEFNNNILVDNYGNFMYLCENGDINMGRKKLTKYDNAVHLYESGMSIQDCADYYEISRQAMHKILTRRNCKFRDNLKYGDENHFFRESDPDNTKKRRVQHFTDKAIRKGILIRPVKCERCGNTQAFSDGRNGIQAHHSDYDRPLDVMWLCQNCHHEWHKINTAINEKNTEEGNSSGRIDILTGGFP